jgi:hypothetical protein
MAGTLHEDLRTFMIVSRWILFRMRNGSDKSYRENQITHFMFNNFFSENRTVYDIMSEMYCGARQATDDNIIQRMRFECWKTKVIDTRSE